MERSFKIKVDGLGVRPDTIRVDDIFDILVSLQKAFAAAAQRQGKLEDEPLLFLSTVEGGSATYELAATDAALRGAKICASAIASNDLSALPRVSRDRLRRVWGKVHSKQWTVDFLSPSGQVDARLSYDVELNLSPSITGRTTIAGKVVRVGGIEDPTVQLHLIDGQKITADVADEGLAKELGNLLYRVVELEGEATWSSDAWKLVDFKVEALGPYDDRPSVSDALTELREIADGFWDDVDPDEYIAELRAE